MTSTTQYTVVGDDKLHCEGCERRVGRALKRMGGIREVEASYRTQRVAVEYDPGRLAKERSGRGLSCSATRSSLGDLLGSRHHPDSVGVDARPSLACEGGRPGRAWRRRSCGSASPAAR